MTDKHETAVAVIDHAQVDRLHPMVRAVMRDGLDPGTIREMMLLQREWEAGEAKRAYTMALVDLKRELPAVVPRDKLVNFATSKGGRVSYRHTTIAALMDAVTPVLTQYGFSINWEPASSDGKVSVTCRLTHSAGHSEVCTLSAPVDTSGSKSAAQGTMSTVTLLSRYTAMSLLGVVSGETTEPEGEPERSPDAHDANRSLAAVRAAAKYGKGLADCEKHLGRDVDYWTEEDIGKLAAWCKPQPVPPREREPGDDDDKPTAGMVPAPGPGVNPEVSDKMPPQASKSNLSDALAGAAEQQAERARKMIGEAKSIEDMTAVGAKIQSMGLAPEAIQQLRAMATQKIKELRSGNPA